MELGTFLFGACAAFAAVTLAAPAVSWLLLRGERARLAATFRPAPLAPVFFTETLLWVAAACVAGFVLAVILGVVVLANSHGARAYNAPVVVPWMPVLVVGGLLGLLALFGYWLHELTLRKLLPPESGPLDVLSLKDG